jgi:hypothetical protein
MFEIGQFINIKISQYPALIVQLIENDVLLVSIVEYDGDYQLVDILVDLHDDFLCNLKPCEEFNIISKYGSWYYDQHKLLLQELIIKNIIKIII